MVSETKNDMLRMNTTVVSDILAVVTYVLVIYVGGTGGWLLTGIHGIVQYCLEPPKHRTIVVSILQISHTCRHGQAILPAGAQVASSLLGIMLAVLSRSKEFARAPDMSKAVIVMLIYTFSMSVRYPNNAWFDVFRIALFIGVNQILSKTSSAWIASGQSCWILACQIRALLIVAVVQMAHGHYVTYTNSKDGPVETWSLRRDDNVSV